MAADTAVAKTNRQTHTGLGTPRSRPVPVRSSLSRQERALLGGAFAFAFLAVAISILARSAPAWPQATSVLGIGLLIFSLGGGAGVSAFLALRAKPVGQARAQPIATHLAGLLEASPNGVAIWDKHDHLLRANTKYTEFLELASADLILGSPRGMIRAMGGRPLEGILDNECEAIRNGRGAFAVSRFITPGGDKIETLVDVTRLQDHEDVLSQKDDRVHHLVEEMKFLTSQSEHFFELIEGLEDELVSERNRAEAAGNAKKAFLSHMSHELRTPLNAILGFADMMRARIFGPLGHEKYAEYADDIYDSGEQLLGLIADILDVSQIQSGEMAVDRQPVELEKTVTDCLASIRPQIFASGISLVEKIDPLPTVHADPLAVRQILMHILSNAMKFTPTGGRISIKSEVDLNSVSLIVEDTGIGITPEIMARLDQPFSAIDQDAQISGEHDTGLGLGLSVARALARLNGGSIALESTVGCGTIARITLPRR